MSRAEALDQIDACIALVAAAIQASAIQTLATILLSRRLVKSQSEPLHFSEVIELVRKAAAVTQ